MALFQCLHAKIGVKGFEPSASWSRTMRDTKLRYTPTTLILYSIYRYLSIITLNFSKLK